LHLLLTQCLDTVMVFLAKSLKPYFQYILSVYKYSYVLIYPMALSPSCHAAMPR